MWARVDLLLLSSFLLTHSLVWYLVFGYTVGSAFWNACGSVLALFLIAGWFLFAHYNEDVPKPSFKVTSITFGALIGLSAMVWFFDGISLMLEHFVIFSTITIGGGMFAFYWFIYSNKEARTIFLQVSELCATIIFCQ